jgi:hypothetical protein
MPQRNESEETEEKRPTRVNLNEVRKRGLIALGQPEIVRMIGRGELDFTGFSSAYNSKFYVRGIPHGIGVPIQWYYDPKRD